MYEKREPITFAVEGQKIFGVFHQPIEKKSDTVVLFLHGLGGNKVGKNAFFVTMATELAKRGIASLRFDFRGSGDSEGEYENLTFSNQLKDAEAAYDWLDGREVAVIGTSMGGLVASLLCLKKRVKALALWAPVFDAHQWKQAWQKIPSGKTHVMHRDRLVSMQFFKEFFTLPPDDVRNGASKQPLLCICGGGDATIDETHGKLYQEAVPEGMFVTLSGADHHFSDYEHRQKLHQITLDWLQGVL